MEEFDLRGYYYNVLKSREQRQYFRGKICMKFNRDIPTFDQWVSRGNVPGYAQVIIQDIIRDDKDLPKI